MLKTFAEEMINKVNYLMLNQDVEEVGAWSKLVAESNVKLRNDDKVLYAATLLCAGEALDKIVFATELANEDVELLIACIVFRINGRFPSLEDKKKFIEEHCSDADAIFEEAKRIERDNNSRIFH